MAERFTLRLVAAALLAALPVACTSDGAASKHSVPPPATSARLLPPPTSSTTSASTSSAVRRATLALLSAADLPAGFTEGGPATGAIPQPCRSAGATPVEAQVRPSEHVSRQFQVTTPPAVMTEDVYVFASAAQAIHLDQLTKQGLGCPSGALAAAGTTTQQVQVEGPADISAVVGVPAGTITSWTLQNGRLTASFALAVDRNVVTTLTFLAPTSSELSKLPSGPALARAALSKVHAARLH